MKNKILIRRPSKSFGNVGDIALIETIKKEFKTKSIVYDIPNVRDINQNITSDLSKSLGRNYLLTLKNENEIL